MSPNTSITSRFFWFQWLRHITSCGRHNIVFWQLTSPKALVNISFHPHSCTLHRLGCFGGCKSHTTNALGTSYFNFGLSSLQQKIFFILTKIFLLPGRGSVVYTDYVHTTIICSTIYVYRYFYISLFVCNIVWYSKYIRLTHICVRHSGPHTLVCALPCRLISYCIACILGDIYLSY